MQRLFIGLMAGALMTKGGMITKGGTMMGRGTKPESVAMAKSSCVPEAGPVVWKVASKTGIAGVAGKTGP